MKKKRKKNDYKILIIMIIVLFIVVTTNYLLKDTINIFLENIYLKKENSLIIKDSLTKNYINSLEKEIKEYKEINSIINCINSSVIYRHPSYWYDVVTINKGKKDGIKKGQIVINNEGVVGVISNVYLNTSEIDLITNINKKEKITLAINTGDKVSYGILSNYDKIRNEMIITELTSDIVYEDDISVTTTSFTKTFKEGILIAKVKNIKEDSNGLSKIVVGEPVVDYNDLKYVCVIKE